ncbi:DUF4136 domain-containing protein [Sneathiella litorea]|uniref:DUF4136 domain-containing protein n=1 Tax=Sneathiella litorea TaxID=2606216 RepID=A0A6L8W4T0_9PROT|nr:DUF4136 domain-containing protein [Sneathiella litorea]MZR30126.1 DUF4136 domain-containing protein [Sneathiella litorea]
MKFFVLLIAGMLLTACANPTVEANVTSFFTPDLAGIKGKNIVIRAHPEAKESSLEFLNYRPKIADKLRLVGFVVQEESPDPDYIAYVSYGVDGTEPRSTTTSSPMFGGLGLGVYGGSGPYYGGSIGRTYNTQTWVEYNRFIAIDIVEGKTKNSPNPVRVYEGRAQSAGRCPTLTGVFDEVLDALFQDFPGINGKTVFVSIPWDGSCE